MKKLNLILAFLLMVGLIGAFLGGSGVAGELNGLLNPSSTTLYMRSDVVTVNGLVCRSLNESIGSVSGTFTLGYDGYWYLNSYYGIRVFQRSISGVETELSSGEPVAVYTWNAGLDRGEGVFSGQWTCPSRVLAPSDCLVIRVYMKLQQSVGTGWVEKGVFCTGQLGVYGLQSSSWTVDYYCASLFRPDGEYFFSESHYLYGTINYLSCVKGLSFLTVSSPASPSPTSSASAQVALTLGVSGSGVVYPGVGTFLYTVGSQVAISASANEGSVFKYWLFDDGSKSYGLSKTVTLSSSRSVLAVFDVVVSPSPSPSPSVSASPSASDAPSVSPSPSVEPSPTFTSEPSPEPTVEPTPIPIITPDEYDEMRNVALVNQFFKVGGLGLSIVSGVGLVLANPERVIGKKRW